MNVSDKNSSTCNFSIFVIKYFEPEANESISFCKMLIVSC